MTADLRIVPAGVVQHCNCCKADYTEEQFQALPFVGRQAIPADDEDCDLGCRIGQGIEGVSTMHRAHGHDPDCEANGYTLELRNCPCGSTLTAKLTGCLP